MAQLEAVHTASTVRGLRILSERCSPDAATQLDSAPTYLTRSTYADCLLGAGSALAVVDAVVAASNARGDGAAAPAGFALCRPPGHHAVPRGAMGFCIVNNASIAARHAQTVHGLRRVLIVDFDVHHGNGTSDAFWTDPDVMFISTHQVCVGQTRVLLRAPGLLPRSWPPRRRR